MNNIGKLIKAKIIPFNDTLIKYYVGLGLNETEAMILMVLYNQQEEGKTFLSIKELKKQMSISEDDLSAYVMLLVQKGMIELLIDEDGKEKYNLNQIMDKLGLILEKKESSDFQVPVDVNEIVSFIEKIYARPLSPADLIIINNWVSSGYSVEEVKKAIMESTKVRKTHLKYADAILANQKKMKRTVRETDSDIKEMLDKLYVKRH